MSCPLLGEVLPMKIKMDQYSKPYRFFANVYEQTMQDVPYLQWVLFVHGLIRQYGWDNSIDVLDLACGTGIFTRRFAELYPNVVGVDRVYEMLDQGQGFGAFRAVSGDITSLPFSDHSFEMALSTHDSLNYIINYEDLLAHMKEVYRVLRPGGVYLFDVSTEYNVRQYYHEKSFHERHGRWQIDWKNLYLEDERKIISTIDFTRHNLIDMIARFLRLNPGRGVFRELHEQRIYTDQQWLDVIEQSGFIVNEIYSDYHKKKLHEKSCLAVYVVRKG